MLEGASGRPQAAGGETEVPSEPIEAALFARLVALETAAGATPQQARAKALATLAERDTALASIELPTPPPMTAAELRQRIDRLNETLAAG